MEIDGGAAARLLSDLNGAGFVMPSLCGKPNTVWHLSGNCFYYQNNHLGPNPLDKRGPGVFWFLKAISRIDLL